MAEEKRIEEQFWELIKSKHERLTPDYTNVDAEIDKLQDLSLEYERMQETDYSRDMREIAADWSMSDGDKDDAYEKIENLVKYKEERASDIEKEMSVILTKELLPPYPVSDIDIQQDGNMYYIGRQIHINGEWMPYTNDSGRHFINKDEAITMYSAMKVDQISKNIGIDSLPSLVPYNKPVLINPDHIEHKILRPMEVLPMAEQRNLEMQESLHPNTKASIEKNFGNIEFVHEEGRHAIVKGRDSGDYKAMRIENEPHGQRIYVKSGFPDYEQAMDQVNRDLKRELQPKQKLEQNPNQELSR